MDQSQFTAFVNGEQEKLRRFLLALCCGNRDEADDIAQETLLKAYLSSATYREEGKFAAWVYKIAYRTFLDGRKSRSAATNPLDTAAAVPDQSQQADSVFRYQELHAALAALPPKERTALLLFYMQGYSVREIAQIVACSEDAVRQQLSRGRDQLKQKIKR